MFTASVNNRQIVQSVLLVLLLDDNSGNSDSTDSMALKGMVVIEK